MGVALGAMVTTRYWARKVLDGVDQVLGPP